jgi:quercetin dioxygenase-like cupin family protein
MKKLFPVLILASAVLAFTSWATAEQAGHVVVKPGDVKWADAPPSLPPGAKMAWIEGAAAEPKPFTFRIKVPANYRVPPHWHPGIEHVTVLSGTFNVGMGEKFDAGKLTPLPAGSLLIIPPKTPHFVQVKEETIIQVHGVGPWGLNYVNPQDDPRKK